MINIDHYKEKLEKELKLVETELQSVGRINPSHDSDWEATATDTEIQHADQNEVADQIEELEENTGIVKQLETRFHEIKSALAKIEDGTYGVCVVCKEQIEDERLKANPAADTCIKHIK